MTNYTFPQKYILIECHNMQEVARLNRLYNLAMQRAWARNVRSYMAKVHRGMYVYRMGDQLFAADYNEEVVNSHGTLGAWVTYEMGEEADADVWDTLNDLRS